MNSPPRSIGHLGAPGAFLVAVLVQPALSGSAEPASLVACDAVSVATAVVPATGPGGTGRLFVAGTTGTDAGGFVRAFTVDATGELIEDPVPWATSVSTARPDERRIVTFDGQRGQPLRGGESPDPALASRETGLGAIAHAVPAYLGAPQAPYPDHWGQGAPENTAPYSGFAAAHADRAATLFVAAEDGMLHAFDTATGYERFAYVPGPVLSALPAPADPDSGRRHAVDASPIVMDAYFDDTHQAWRTVLVGGLGAGGQGLYALDVTEIPAADAGEDAFAQTVLWEFTDADDADLGFTFSEPNVVRLANREWTVVVGNGYGNTSPDDHPSGTGSAVLYVLDVETGALLARIDTREGRRQDPAGLGRANGLSTVAPMDVDGDFVVDYVFGGDLFGNLWKFDLRSRNPGEWRVAHDGYTSDPQPFFRARSATDEPSSAQPIVFRPQVIHPPGHAGHVLVVFVTGADYPDVANTPAANAVQTVYGVLDRGDAHTGELTREHLLRQGIVPGADGEADARRAITRLPLAWHRATGVPLQPMSCTDSDPANDPAGGCTYLGWYLDLPGDGETPVAAPRARGERLVFVTGKRSTGNCVGGGWVHEVDLSNGGAAVPGLADGPGGGSVDVTGHPVWEDADGRPVGITARPLPVPSAGLPVFLDGLPPAGAGPRPPADSGSPPPSPRFHGCTETAYVAGVDGVPVPTTGSCGERELGRLHWEELF